jgi:hypothetical protein
LCITATGSVVRASADRLTWAPVSGDALGAGHDQAFVIGGQSNADGRGSLTAAAAATEVPSPGCKLFTKGGKIEVCAEPAGKQDAGWINNIPSGATPGDPAYSFCTAAAKEILRLTGVRPLMVPCAIGSTTLSMWAPPAVEKDVTSLFGQLHDRAEKAVRLGQSPVFIWSGHEGGGQNVTENLATGVISVGSSAFVTEWRQHWQALRNRFANCGIIFVQLGARDSDMLILRKGAEAQRRSEDVASGSVAIVAYEAVASPVYLNRIRGNNATNTGVYLAPGQVQFAGDGSSALGADMLRLVTGNTYRIGYSWTGTGTVKITIDGAEPAVAIAPGTATTVNVVAGASGDLIVYRNASGTAINGTFAITSVEEALTWKIPGAAMVVQHDLPRNANPDGLHLSTQGHIELGKRIGKAYAERILKNTAVNGTGPRLVSCTKSAAVVKVKFTKEIAADANGYGAALATSLFRVYLAGVEQTLNEVIKDPDDNTAVRITCAASVASGVCVVTYGERAAPGTETVRPGCVYDLDGMPAPMMGPIIAAAA